MVSHGAHALADLAPAAGPVEGKGGGVRPPGAGGRFIGARLSIFREQLPDGRVQVREGGHVGALHAAGGELLHGYDAGKLPAAADDIFLSGLPVASGEERKDQRGFSRAGGAGNRGQAAGGKIHIQVLQVVEAGVSDLKLSAVPGTEGLSDRRNGAQITAGDGSRMGKQVIQRSRSDYFSAETSGAGTDLYDVVGGAHHVRVVLDDQNGVSQIAQAFQEKDQPFGVPGVQSRGRLVQNIDQPGQLRRQGGGKLQPLQLPAGQGGDRPAAGQIPKPQPADAGKLCGKVRQIVLYQAPAAVRQRRVQIADPAGKCVQRKAGKLRKPDAVYRNLPAFLLQPLSAAGRAGSRMKISLQLSPFFAPVVQSAKQNRQKSLKPSAGYGTGRLFSRKGAGDLRTFHTLVQEGLLQRIKPKDRKTGRDRKAVVPAGRVKGFGLVYSVFGLPEPDGPFFQRPGFVHGGGPVEGADLAHAFTDRAGPFLRIKRKIRRGELFHFPAAGAAVLADQIFLSALTGTGGGADLFPAVGRADLFPAVRAGTHSQLFPERPQIGIEICHCAHGGTGIAVLVGLGDHNGRRSVFYVLYRRLRDSLKGYGLQILPLTFHVQNVD